MPLLIVMICIAWGRCPRGNADSYILQRQSLRGLCRQLGGVSGFSLITKKLVFVCILHHVITKVTKPDLIFLLLGYANGFL